MTTENLVLVANDKGGTISTLRVEEDRLVPVTVSEVGAGCSTFAVDAANDLVYAATRQPGPAIVTLRLDRRTGELTEVARREIPNPVAYLTLTHATLLAASYHGDWGASYPVADGVVGDPATTVRAHRMHAAVADPRGENAYFVSLGDDLIVQRAIAVDSEVVELSEPTVNCMPASGPRHLVISADGRNAYLLTEFTAEATRFERLEGGRLERRETAWAFDRDSGLHQSAYGADPLAGHLIWGADLALADGQRWLLCTERTESTVVAVELDDRGHFTGRTVLSRTEQQPRGMTVSPDGSLVVVVGERSDHASLYRIDDGALVRLDRTEVGRGPNWVRFV
ncbi:MAG: beta-propeller fold lactonase family protein [Tessaracoccus sp.]|uniref:lactonase family protein n=1 Tax=Tessaracoccus sp. TaxID=1971211 RepID=UPI001ED10ED0|nr:beta-propeller fold lactonase family protein [Tessaracoccus sp.]MBK7822081.1 beta-propeller fold lactonase family protein [Tessaracoccus sp.]